MSRLIKAGERGTLDVCSIAVRNSLQMLTQFDEPEPEPEPAEDDLVEKAEQQAMDIVRAARAEADSIREKAYAAGYNAGLVKATSDAGCLLERLERDIAGVAAERAALVDSLEPEVLKLCLEIVEKIIRHEIKTDQRVVIRQIKSCMRRIRDREQIDVRVSPQEVEYVRAQRDELLSIAEGARGVSIIDDRRISPGGCIVESASGTFDARIETQVEQVRKKLMETYDNDRRQQDAGPQ